MDALFQKELSAQTQREKEASEDVGLDILYIHPPKSRNVRVIQYSGYAYIREPTKCIFNNLKVSDPWDKIPCVQAEEIIV